MTKPTYKLSADADFDDFRKKCEEDGWDLAYDNGTTTKVFRKKGTGAPIDPVRVWADLPNIQPEILYDILHDHEYRTVWDENMISGVVIEQLDDRNEIGYYSAKSPVAVSNRDFLNQRMWRQNTEKGEWIIWNHAVEHPDWPEKKGFVRATSICSGYLITRRAEGGSRFVYYTQCNLNGWIPGFVINSATTTFAPKMVDKLSKAALEYPAWKQAHNPDNKPWLK
eukprot:TRINITY_DN1244_c0_g1_i1.p1 TRINITY_DN1244_c0_g1~~TRINITY_DN1244_c0_g1_i1.p1  ORF type:complete len:255 (-),score=105.90 TRINITY_DN1244_c0_g1_i1:156-827(-)